MKSVESVLGEAILVRTEAKTSDGTVTVIWK